MIFEGRFSNSIRVGARSDKPLIIINESMQFSAGVNLNYVMEFVKKRDFKSVEKFIKSVPDLALFK